jgi:ATP-dependent DNA helicase RecQ
MTLRAFGKIFKDEKFDLLLYVPSTVSGDLVKNFAEKIAETLEIPISHNLVKTRETKEQKIFQSTIGKKNNLRKAFDYQPVEEIAGKTILLIDDIFDSGATIKEIGKLLTNMGAIKIAPLVIARTVGGDLV